MRRHADGFGRPWAAVAGSGQRAAGQGKAYRGRVEGAGHPGTQAPWNLPPPVHALASGADHVLGRRAMWGGKSFSKTSLLLGDEPKHDACGEPEPRGASGRLGADVVREPRDCVEPRWKVPDLC